MKLRTLAEIVIGVLYALGAVGQAGYVLRHSADFYRAMADRAWFPPGELLVERVLLPNSSAVTIMVVVFEAVLAVGILTGGSAVGPALMAGGIFSIVGALTGSPGETVGYGALAAVHFWLAAAH